jgi:hypothetical protein
MSQPRTIHEPLRPSSVSRRALLLAAAPAALLLAPAASAAAAAEPIRASVGAPTPICTCSVPQGPMRVIGWAAHRLA